MTQKLRSFKNNRKGIAWVIGVAFLSVALMPIVYFPLSMAWDQTYAAVADTYVFTGIYVNVIIVVQLIISYILVFGIVFTLAWAITNAKSRRYDA